MDVIPPSIRCCCCCCCCCFVVVVAGVVFYQSTMFCRTSELVQEWKPWFDWEGNPTSWAGTLPFVDMVSLGPVFHASPRLLRFRDLENFVARRKLTKSPSLLGGCSPAMLKGERDLWFYSRRRKVSLIFLCLSKAASFIVISLLVWSSLFLHPASRMVILFRAGSVLRSVELAWSNSLICLCQLYL